MNRRSKESVRPCTFGVLCNWFPYPIRNGSNRRLSELISHLAESGHQVDLVVIGRNYWWRQYLADIPVRNVRYLVKPSRVGPKAVARGIYWFFVDLLRHVGLPKVSNFISRLKDAVRLGPEVTKANYWTLCPDDIAETIPVVAEQGGWRAVIVEYLWLHSLIDDLPDPITRIIDTHDVMHIRHLRLSERGLHSPFPIDDRQEAALLSKFDCVIAIQEAERQSFLRLREKYCLEYEVVTLGVSCDDTARKAVRSDSDSRTILFVGGMNIVNEEGLRRFLMQVWPGVLQKHADWRLNVCGPVCSCFESNHWNGVNLVGVVDELTPYYESAAIVVNPVWAGTGLKIKSVEALAYGKPLLTTPSGIEGMTGNIAESCLVARDERDFSEKALYLIENADIRRSLALSARDYFDKNLFSSEVYRDFDCYLNTI